ncbi:NLR family CARD domain-containing protein 3 [Gadus chalcogrammus]|uniref:NLR family CARD domain-containing protein 3 n=1 Tax=Gadus chalcogrammus TaxID=1042646 RepID=UPI0024C3532B|nr:NLR family CARD domain-containing protein 3 [Gadus chalcogrammus]
MELGDTDSDSLPFGEGVSGRGGDSNEGGNDDDDDLYYIPERRASLDLGQESSPGDGAQWWCQPAVLSYTTMGSDEERNREQSMEDQDESRVLLESNGSFSSDYSFNSDCEKTTRKIGSKAHPVRGHPKKPPLLSDFTEPPHPSLTLAFTFQAIRETLEKMPEGHLRHFKETLWRSYPQSLIASPQSMDLLDLVDRMLGSFNIQGSLQIVKNLLEEMGQEQLVLNLQELCVQNEVRFELRQNLKCKYRDVQEDSAIQGEKKLFHDIYTDLHMIKGLDNGPNVQHEYRNIEKLNSYHKPEPTISSKDIFGSNWIEKKCLKALLMTGMAGTGKSMAVQKFILDWAEERSHQHISFLFPLPFRELNAFQGSEISMLHLLNQLYPETKKLKDICAVGGHVLFVLDGLDEYTQELDFQYTEIWCDFKEATPFNVLLVNFLRGNLFFSGLLWVTSRPLRSKCMPSEGVHQVAEVWGFTDDQKVEYFKRRFTDPVHAGRVIDYVNSCKTLHIMCHLPLFCSVLSQLWERRFAGQRGDLPQSITPIYTQLLLVLLSKRRLRAPARSPSEERNFLVGLGKTAWLALEQGQVKITEAHQKAGIGGAMDEAVVNSGLCTEFTVKQFVMYSETVHCFIHSTVQEYMAALYVFLEFRNQGMSVFKESSKRKQTQDLKNSKQVYSSALERTLLCEDGRFNLFLRFLFGMASKSNVELLKHFIGSTENWPSVVKDTVALIKKKMSEKLQNHPETRALLQSCLDELTPEN